MWNKGIKKTHVRTAAVILCLHLLSAACGTIQKRALDDPFGFSGSGLTPYPITEARAVFENIQNKNRGLTTVKGIGNLRFRVRGENDSHRIAWIGHGDGRIRIEIMGPHGQAVASLAADGHDLYYYSPLEKKFRKKRLTDSTLQSYLQIPVTVKQLVDLISGRIPVDAPSQIALTKTDGDKGWLLYMYQEDEKRIIRMVLSPDRENVERMDILNLKNMPLMQMGFTARKMIDGFNIPFQITIADDKEATFNLEMDRVWANMAVDEAIFSLIRPNE